ncbi:MAG: RNA-binding transcriptional accessory protein [Bacillaceae bacterium]|nr:RNA-binding transcriptional accessory protein [Bacillaceae bacterium]
MQNIAEELGIGIKQVQQTVQLLDEGNTVPFIARYRKERTGELDEEQIRRIEERLQYLRNLEERKQEVLRLIDEQGKLTDELEQKIKQAIKLQEVEDLYRPYRQKRRTRATVAREKGLEPLAHILLEQKETDLLSKAGEFIDTDKEVGSAEEALQGAMDFIAEMVSDDADVRKWVRRQTYDKGVLTVEKKEEEDNPRKVYEMYYDYQEPVHKVVPHRVLAINRGEKEGILKVQIEAPVDEILGYLQKKYITRPGSEAASYLKEALEDGYKRLIAPSIERDVRNELSEKAEEQAIHIFSENLRNLLLQPPVRGKIVMGVDPAYRTGCKLAVIDETGKLLDISVIYPTPPENRVEEAKKIVKALIERHGVNLIAIGNGTASRETEQFIADTIREMNQEIYYLIVNEAGASVYSASPLAKEEFPKLDVAERSAISIARRLQDPLAELVKIDPKSIGVGQYQHDVTQSRLSESLHHVVESAVNYVGVDVNTASSSLLQYVAGLSKPVARNIVKYKEENGKIRSREQLKNVPRLGAKTFEQAAGFLRIPDGENPLDNTPIHPESYEQVNQLLSLLDIDPSQLADEQNKEKLRALDIKQVAEQVGLGVPTMKDIVDSLLRPGRDPRDELPRPLLKSDVLTLEDLKEGMELQGTVRNVVDFGVFVDIGLKNDGLVHISRMSRKFVKHPLDVVSVGDIVNVWVIGVDQERGRVSLSMIAPEEGA